MATKTKFQAIRGTRDLLPPETTLWNRVEQTAHEVFATFGYGEIRLPIFEQTELFARSIGADTDVVAKEMYSFPDYPSKRLGSLRTTILARPVVKKTRASLYMIQRLVGEFLGELKNLPPSELTGTAANSSALRELESLYRQFLAGNRKLDRFPERLAGLGNEMRESLRAVQLGPDVTLRPEATASVCRAYIEHGMHALPQPVKLYYMGPMFRRERPQKGRYRQFYQIGAEVLGGPDAPAIDAELIEMLMVFFGKLGLEGAALYINSIGCKEKECRPKYVETLRAALTKVKEKLGPDSQRRIETNPLRVLDSKLEDEQKIIEALPRIADHLCEPCRANYAEVKRQIDLRGIAYQENWRLVRGLDYYMRTTFEITAPGLGSQNAVCGGGRYDGLVELLGGPPAKGIGFAIGEDRLILSLQEVGKARTERGLDVYIAWLGEKAYATAVGAAKTLRDAGVSVELPPLEQKFGKALGHADKLGARYALILGEDEIASGQWTLKTLADGTQKKVPAQQILSELKRVE